MAEQIKGLTTKAAAPAAKAAPKAAPKPDDEELLDEREVDEAAVEARRRQLAMWPLEAIERR